jgi:hypothetical protein
VEFLNKHFGITKVKETDWGGVGAVAKGWDDGYSLSSKPKSGQSTLFNERYGFKELEEIKPVATKGNVWGAASAVRFDKVS